jgi:hypothetical protein
VIPLQLFVASCLGWLQHEQHEIIANESAARQAMPRSESMPSKIANQQQPEINTRWQARPTHLRIKTGALGFREIIEAVFAQQLIQTPIKRVTRGCR